MCKKKWSMEMCFLSSYAEQFGIQTQRGVLLPANKQGEIWRDRKSTCVTGTYT